MNSQPPTSSPWVAFFSEALRLAEIAREREKAAAEQGVAVTTDTGRAADANKR